MAGKPKVLKVNERKRPRVVKEEDYSLMLEKREEEGEEKGPEHVMFKGLKEKRGGEKKEEAFPVSGDQAAEKLREQALQDITPLEKGKHFVQEKKGEENPLHKRVKKFLGMQ